jgi:hypothetical protein
MPAAMQKVLSNNDAYAPTTYTTAAAIAATNFLVSPEKYTLFPIPAGEMALDQVLTQNPGW